MKYYLSEPRRYKEINGNKIIVAIKIYCDMEVANGADAGTEEGFIMKKGSYLMKEYNTPGKFKYIDGKIFKSKYKRIIEVCW